MALTPVTTNYKLKKPRFDESPWHDDVNGNFDKIDALFKAVGLVNVSGAWENSAIYAVGDRVFDDTDGTLWLAKVAHTSAAMGTFAEDRVANPTYWTAIDTGLVSRGAFVAGTAYQPGDVYYSTTEHVVGVVLADHTGSANPRTDEALGYVDFIVDMKPAVDASAASAATASGAAAAALVSEGNAAASAVSASGSASAAAGSAVTAGNAATTASGHATTATTQAGIATTQAGIATTQAGNASTSAATATTQAGIATTKAGEANTSAVAAASSETNAAASAVLAGRYATYPEDTDIPGTGGQRSAFHWAQKAASNLISAILGWTTQATPLDADIMGYVRASDSAGRKFTFANLKTFLAGAFPRFDITAALTLVQRAQFFSNVGLVWEIITQPADTSGLAAVVMTDLGAYEEVELDVFITPAGGAVSLYLDLSTDNASSWLALGTTYRINDNLASTGTMSYNYAAESGMLITGVQDAIAAGSAAHIRLNIKGLNKALVADVDARAMFSGSGVFNRTRSEAMYVKAAVANALRIRHSGGGGVTLAIRNLSLRGKRG